MIKHLEKENLDDLVKEGIHLVDFYADWCGPCKMLAPILETLENVNVIKVNVDEHRDLSIAYGVMSIPTMVFFKDGEVAHKVVGLHSKEEIEEIIQKIK